MTIKEIADQIYKMSKGRVNGEKYTKRELEAVFRMWMRTGSEYIGIVVLRDGEWLFLIDRFGSESNEYDYYIPDTREHEKSLYRVLGIG